VLHALDREGEQVRIACDEHYELSQEGEVMPRCLSSGEWEVGKTCVPIMCDPYQPPEHGTVFPDTAVMAGTTVRFLLLLQDVACSVAAVSSRV
jgi:hypothetical protein